MAKQIYVSKEGFEKLQNELEHLKTVKRVEVAEAIKKARAYGDRVKIYDFEHDKEYEYRIVGVTEADPFENKISDDSPIGKALLGSRRGDTVTVEAPKGIIKFNIVEISR